MSRANRLRELDERADTGETLLALRAAGLDVGI